MKIYKLIKAENGEEVRDRESVLDVVVGDAIVDLKDGFCMCYKCDREYDLSNDDETNEFLEHHTSTTIVSCVQIYRCYKARAE